MTPGQEMQVQEKRELQKDDESTIPVRAFVPTTDIYETDQALTVVMEMPGVDWRMFQRGRRATSPGLYLNSYSRHAMRSSEPSMTISSRFVVMTANRP